MLYEQNGDRIVTIDSATSIHPMYKRVVCNWVDSLQASSLSKVSTVSVNLPSAFKTFLFQASLPDIIIDPR